MTRKTLKKLMLHFSVSLEELAKELAVSPSHMQLILSGSRRICPQLAAAIRLFFKGVMQVTVPESYFRAVIEDGEIPGMDLMRFSALPKDKKEEAVINYYDALRQSRLKRDEKEAAECGIDLDEKMADTLMKGWDYQSITYPKLKNGETRWLAHSADVYHRGKIKNGVKYDVILGE